MKIIFDVQGAQSEGSRFRGIGRYSIALIKSIISNFPDDEYILFANSSLYDIRSSFKNELTSSTLNVKYFQWYAPSRPANLIAGENAFDLLAVQLRSYALSLLNADVLLITSFFEGFTDNCIVEWDYRYSLPSIFVILYDLIPLIYQSQYLTTNPTYENFYRNKLKLLTSADGLLAISKSAANEGKNYLDFDQNFIFNISSACNKEIFKIQDNESQVQSFIEKRDLGEYILYSGAADHRKNISTLIKAYSKLPDNLIVQYSLVFVGRLSQPEINMITHCAFLEGLPIEYIRIMGYVTDKELVELYQNCSLFVFPSVHEGFGLPVLEAMCCGAPVITSNLSSLPEIVNEKKALFDPYDVDSLCLLISKCLTDNIFRDDLIKNSEIRSHLFSWDLTAKNAYNAFKKIINIKKLKENSNLTQIDSLSINRENFGKIKKHLSDLYDSKKVTISNYILKIFCSSISLIDEQIRRLRVIDSVSSLSSNDIWKLEGPFDSSYSLAIVNYNLSIALYDLGINLYLNSAEGFGSFEPNKEFLDSHEIVNSLFYKYKSSNYKKFTINSRNLYPPRVSDMSSDINLLHAYGWEETGFPQEWVDEFNRNLNGITVMSNLVKKILIDNGVYIPIDVCGLGLDHIKITNSLENNSNYYKRKTNFKFLHISSCFPRKGIDSLLNAYGQAFMDSDDVVLTIKTFKNEHNNIVQLIKKYQSQFKNFPNIRLIDKDLTADEITQLYLESDALVIPSFGEGFGLPIGEAMRLGLPVITTRWGGQNDYCSDENSWLIDYQFKYSLSHFGINNSIWAEPSVTHLSSLLKDIYNANPSLISKKTEAAKHTISQYKWSSVAKKNCDFINKIMHKISYIEPRIGWISTWQKRCGIASYSRNLLNFFSDYNLILASTDKDNIFIDQSNVFRCWQEEMSDQQDLSDLENIILDKNLNSVVIQFNFGFFNKKRFSEFLSKLKARSISIILIMHSTMHSKQLSKYSESKSFLSFYTSLKLCDRILVHSLNDINFLKNVGLVQNVSLFPHGIIDFNNSIHKKRFFNSIQFKQKCFSIATYGFCLPNKGLKELIMSIHILVKNYKLTNIKLTLMTAIYSKSYLYYVDELKEYSESLGMTDYISFNTKYYLEDLETINRLSHYDLIVYPYQYSTESSSAAVRNGIASNSKILVTPLHIFNDVQDVVCTLDGFSPESIAKGIYQQFLERNSKSKKLKSDLKIKKKDWLKNHRFSFVSRRLENLVRGVINNQ